MKTLKYVLVVVFGFMMSFTIYKYTVKDKDSFDGAMPLVTSPSRHKAPGARLKDEMKHNYENIITSLGSNGDFLLKAELTGATVITKTETDWSREDASCNGDNSFVKIDYSSFGGHMVLYVHPRDKDNYISETMLRGGTFEGGNVRKIYKLIKQNPDLQFLDIGGNIGVFGLNVAKLGGKVLIVEPQLTNVRKLCHSIRDNKLKDVYVVHNALSSKRMRVGFIHQRGNIGATRIRSSGNSGKENSAYAVLLDDILDVFNFSKVVMKIDVEGHEQSVLQGAEEFFRRVDVRYILMEWHQDKLTTGGWIIDFLTRFGLSPFHRHTDEPLNTTEYKSWLSLGDVVWKKPN